MLMVDLDQTLIHTTEQHCQQMSNKVRAVGAARCAGAVLGRSLGEGAGLPPELMAAVGTVESWRGLEWTSLPQSSAGFQVAGVSVLWDLLSRDSSPCRLQPPVDVSQGFLHHDHRVHRRQSWGGSRGGAPRWRLQPSSGLVHCGADISIHFIRV